MSRSVSRYLQGAGAIGLLSLMAMPACAQTLGLAHGPEISWWRVVAALVFCCLLGGAGALALRYRLRGQAPNLRLMDAKKWQHLVAALGLKTKGKDSPPPRLQLIETVHLSYQVDVCLLECDGASVMIATSPRGAFVINRDAPTKIEVAS